VLDRPVQSLEVGAGLVWAVVLDGSGTGPQLWRGDVRSNTLRYAEQIPNRAATVVVGHGTAYVVAQSIAGPIDDTLRRDAHQNAAATKPLPVRRGALARSGCRQTAAPRRDLQW
jgi:hypothetical protein